MHMNEAHRLMIASLDFQPTLSESDIRLAKIVAERRNEQFTKNGCDISSGAGQACCKK
jgi:hypothetical protein